MRDDVPAALPLIVFCAVLAASPFVLQPRVAALGLLAAALLASRRPRVAIGAAAAAMALLAGSAEQARRAAERSAVATFDPAAFVVVEAPIERDWAARPHYSVLRSSSFRAGGTTIDAPLSIYVRFDPPPVGMEAVVRAEGHLRRDPRGGYTLSVKSRRLLGYEGRLPIHRPATWNRAIAQRLRRHAAGRPDEIAMIEALLLGRGERLSEAAREDFRRGGTYHLLVFSGLQISLAGAAIALLLRWVGAPRAADWSLLGFSLLAPAFIGPEASVSRASMVIALFAVSRIARRPTSPENLWCVAALARLIVVPRDLLDPAFHLTYAGAGALLFIGAPLARTRLRWVAYAIAAEIAIVPLTLFHFHQFALGGSIATIAMTPIVFTMLVAGALFAATEAAIALDLIAALNAVCTAINGVAAAGSGFFAAPPAPAITSGALAALCAISMLRGGRRTAVVIAALLLPSAAALAAFHVRAVVADPRLIILDVGQGDALLLRSRRHVLLVDGGGRHGDARFGEAALLPLLLDRGVRTIDVALLTHAHPDHCIGLAAAVRHLDVRELWISPRKFRGDCAAILLSAAQERRTPVRLLRGGESVSLGGITAEVLLPRRAYRRSPENNNSVVLSVAIGRRRLLLTGDIERDAERDLAGRVGRADVLKVPHHGSRTSASPPLLDAIRPRIGLISCGRNNFFGHPHPAVLGELRKRSIRVWRTDLNGTLETVFRPHSIEVRGEIDTPR